MAKNVTMPEAKDELPHPRYPRSSQELQNRSYVPESQAGDAAMMNVTPTKGEQFRGAEGSSNENTATAVD